jgi:glycosyltransferase 2 family protein
MGFPSSSSIAASVPRLRQEAPVPDAGTGVQHERGPRSVLPVLLLGALVSAGAILLATRGIELGEVAAAIGDANPWPLAVGAALMLASYPVLAVRWRSIASDLGPPPSPQMLELVLIGSAVNNALPARLGEVARSVGLGRSARRPVLQSFGTVVVDRVADVVFFAVVFGATVAVSPTEGWVRWVGLGGAAITVGALAVLAGVAVAMGRRTGDPPTGRLTRHLYTLGEGLRCVRTPAAAARALVLTALAWGSWMVGLWFIADSLAIRLSVAEVLFTTGLLGLGSAVPSAPGFIGTYHWIAASSLGLFGVAGADALAFAVLLHAAWFVPTTVAGSILMVRWGLGYATLRRVSLSTPAVGA